MWLTVRADEVQALENTLICVAPCTRAIGRLRARDPAKLGENLTVTICDEEGRLGYARQRMTRTPLLLPWGVAALLVLPNACERTGPVLTKKAPPAPPCLELPVAGAGLRLGDERLAPLPTEAVPAPDVPMFPQVTTDGQTSLAVWSALGSGRLYAARVTSEGQVLDVPPKAIAPRSVAGRSSVATFDGENFVVVWTDLYTHEIWGVRMAPDDGRLLDPEGVLLESGAGFAYSFPGLATAGGRTLMAWLSEGRLLVAQLSGLKLGQPFEVPISGSATSVGAGRLALASDGASWALAYPSAQPSGGQLVSMAFFEWNPPRLVNSYDIDATGFVQTGPALAVGVGVFLAAWEDPRLGKKDIYGAMLTPAGRLGEAWVLCGAGRNQEEPSVSFDGRGFQVAWQDHREGTGGFPKMYFTPVTVAGAQIPDGKALHGGHSVGFGALAPGRDGRVLAVHASTLPDFEDAAGNLVINLAGESVFGTWLDADGGTQQLATPLSLARVNRHSARVLATEGGAVAVWEEEASGKGTILGGARLGPQGEWLSPLAAPEFPGGFLLVDAKAAGDRVVVHGVAGPRWESVMARDSRAALLVLEPGASTFEERPVPLAIEPRYGLHLAASSDRIFLGWVSLNASRGNDFRVASLPWAGSSDAGSSVVLSDFFLRSWPFALEPRDGGVEVLALEGVGQQETRLHRIALDAEGRTVSARDDLVPFGTRPPLRAVEVQGSSQAFFSVTSDAGSTWLGVLPENGETRLVGRIGPHGTQRLSLAVFDKNVVVGWVAQQGDGGQVPTVLRLEQRSGAVEETEGAVQLPLEADVSDLDVVTLGAKHGVIAYVRRDEALGLNVAWRQLALGDAGLCPEK